MFPIFDTVKKNSSLHLRESISVNNSGYSVSSLLIYGAGRCACKSVCVLEYVSVYIEECSTRRELTL